MTQSSPDQPTPEEAARAEAERLMDEAGVPKLERPYEPHGGQLRMAERLVERHADNLRHAHGLGWLYWDGQRWARDLDGAATRCAVETIKAALREAADMDKKQRDRLHDDVRKTESAAGLNGMLSIASALKPISVAASLLDADPFLFNTQTGTLDLRTGELRAPDPSDLITKVAGCGLDPQAAGPTFAKFLGEILPDEDMRLFVRRVLGYAMLGKVRDHVMPFFVGTGKNGKTTLLDIISKAFGDYAIAAEPELLLERGYAHPTGQADLQGVRLAVCSESDEGRVLAAGTMKRLTGGDKIRARRMRRDFIEFEPSHTLVLVTNHKPRVAGDDPALWRRLAVVPFDVVVPDDQVDTGLPERLALELPAILLWAYEGYRDYDEQGLAPPASVTERTKEYQAASDPLGRFLADHAEENPNCQAGSRELFNAFKHWCTVTGEPYGSDQEFAAAMERRGFKRKRSARGSFYLGLKLTEDQPGGMFSQPNGHV